MKNLFVKYRVSLSILALAILGCGGYLGMQYMKIQEELSEYKLKTPYTSGSGAQKSQSSAETEEGKPEEKEEAKPAEKEEAKPEEKEEAKPAEKEETKTPDSEGDSIAP